MAKINTVAQHEVQRGELLTFVRESEDVDAKFIRVTPFESAYVNKHCNPSNRSLRMNRVADMRRDMLTPGHWPINGETVKFNFVGEQCDGQHRFAALGSIHPGKDFLLDTEGRPLRGADDAPMLVPEDFAVTFLVVAGLALEARDTVDMGLKRTHSDVLGMSGYKHSMTLASTGRKVLLWKRGDTRFSGSRNPTIAELKELLVQHPELMRSAEVANRVRAKFPYVPQSVLGLCHFLFTEIDSDLSAVYFARLEDGANLPKGHPVHTMRESLARGEFGNNPRKNPEQYVAVMIRAWNALRRNKELLKIPSLVSGRNMPTPE